MADFAIGMSAGIEYCISLSGVPTAEVATEDMSMINLRLVFFDLGDVVCQFLPERRLVAFASETPLSAEEIQHELWDSGFSDDCDAGRYSGSQMYAHMCQRLGVSLPQREVRRLWVLAFEPNAEVLTIAAAVRRHLPTGLLTNNPPLLKEALPEFLPSIKPRFDPIIFSYQHGARKPSPDLYDSVVRSTGVSAHEILLIDDSQTNVQGAQSAGWQAVHFHSPNGLRKALGDLGLT